MSQQQRQAKKREQQLEAQVRLAQERRLLAMKPIARAVAVALRSWSRFGQARPA